jgi:hypothetical protein
MVALTASRELQGLVEWFGPDLSLAYLICIYVGFVI